jgi:hypothetical protein
MSIQYIYINKINIFYYDIFFNIKIINILGHLNISNKYQIFYRFHNLMIII